MDPRLASSGASSTTGPDTTAFSTLGPDPADLPPLGSDPALSSVSFPRFPGLILASGPTGVSHPSGPSFHLGPRPRRNARSRPRFQPHTTAGSASQAPFRSQLSELATLGPIPAPESQFRGCPRPRFALSSTNSATLGPFQLPSHGTGVSRPDPHVRAAARPRSGPGLRFRPANSGHRAGLVHQGGGAWYLATALDGAVMCKPSSEPPLVSKNARRP
ncbi:uncharacterized protein CMC5_045930 [Chondromyces crocatus]|uniref:Uncharacterized protein n=1 Tax=Chondromyces crocatus TaxID=52 RepID=A0A0K1EHV4_CHOCO|nr:uncharacterized protein CMC5_045930 [Chondromyces crocatus]